MFSAFKVPPLFSASLVGVCYRMFMTFCSEPHSCMSWTVRSCVKTKVKAKVMLISVLFFTRIEKVSSVIKIFSQGFFELELQLKYFENRKYKVKIGP